MREEPDRDVDSLAYEAIGCAIEVHKHLGPGYLENVYEEALAIEFNLRNIIFERQKEISIQYKQNKVGKALLDFLISNRLILELKAVEELAPVHKAQVISYLRATGFQLALLINFNVTILRDGIQRIVLT